MIPEARITLPRTELSVSRLCLGGNRFGGGLDRDGSFALLDAFVEAGGNFLDTAHVYADWVAGNAPSSSERMIGLWLESRRPADIVVATKGGHPPLSDVSRSRLDAASLRQDAAEALGHLGLERLDLFYLHRDDPARPVADILATLEALRREGLIRHYGASNWTAARLVEAERTAHAYGWQGFVANQAEWSLAARNPGTVASDLCAMDAGMIALHRRTGMAAIPYSAQAKGYFDKLDGGLDEATARLYDNAANRSIAGKLSGLAVRHGASPTQVMLAVLARAPFVTVPVVGCRTPEQVRSSFEALRLPLADADAAELLRLALRSSEDPQSAGQGDNVGPPPSS